MTEEEVRVLLPFHANGSLTGAEAAAVEAALAGNAALREEVAALQALRAAMQEAPLQSPGEFGLARLMRSVEAEEAVAPPRSRRWWRAVAAVAIILALGRVALHLQSQGGPEVVLAGGQTGPALIVAFEDQATMAAIGGLLSGAGLQVVEGPSALGLWRVTGEDLAAGQAALEASDLVDTVELDAGDGGE